MVLNSYIGRTIESCCISYTIVGRIVIATTNYIIPLIIECLKCRLCTISVTKEVPIIIVTHATSSKFKVSADELSTLVILLSRNAHVTLSSQFEILEVSHLKREVYVLLRQYFLTLCTEVVEAEVGRRIHAIVTIIGT